MPRDRTKQWAAGDIGLFHPRLKDANRTRLGVRSIRNTDLPASSILIRFTSAQCDRQTVFAERAVFNVQANDFRAPERASESGQDECPVTSANDSHVGGVYNCANVIRQCWCLLCWCRAASAPNAFH